MKTLILATLLLAPAAAFAAGIQISAREKTLDNEKGDRVDLPHGDARRQDKQVQVVMTIRNMQPANKGKFTVQWAILRKGGFGKVMEVQQKTREVELPIGRDVVVESDPVSLSDIRWDSKHGGNKGSIAEEIHGYGVRVLNEAGEVVGEMYKPADSQGAITWRDPVAKKVPAPDEPRKKWPRNSRVPETPKEEVPGI